MAVLTYGMGQMSLDGYVADRAGVFDWADPGEDLHAHAAEELRRSSVQIYGRRMYELMVFWETAEEMPGMPSAMLDFARAWRSVDKIVVSSTLTEVRSARTRVVPRLGCDELRRLKADAADRVAVSGPTLASAFLSAGLVDEVSMYVLPVIVGGGLPMFSGIEHEIRLEQTEEVALDGVFAFRRYRVLHDADRNLG